MKIHTEDGRLDTAAARREIGAAASTSHAETRRAMLAEVQAAALVDVAESLQILADEVLIAQGAMPAAPVVAEPEPARDFLVVGDIVTVIDDTEPGEILAFGFDQGEQWAEVRFAAGASRFFVRNLERVTPAKITPADVTPVFDAATEIEADTDELDDDFGGDAHTVAASALDTLKANEAQRKAAAKKGGKK